MLPGRLAAYALVTRPRHPVEASKPRRECTAPSRAAQDSLPSRGLVLAYGPRLATASFLTALSRSARFPAWSCGFRRFRAPRSHRGSPHDVADGVACSARERKGVWAGRGLEMRVATLSFVCRHGGVGSDAWGATRFPGWAVHGEPCTTGGARAWAGSVEVSGPGVPVHHVAAHRPTSRHARPHPAQSSYRCWSATRSQVTPFSSRLRTSPGTCATNRGAVIPCPCSWVAP
jgi:hypothetical protein